MKHIAKRLIPYASGHKIIHIDDIEQPALLRLAKDRRTNSKIREALKEIDPQYELLIPYQVDNEENQLRRYIQHKLGTEINLTHLRNDYKKYYLKLYEYGSPKDVIEGWGLTVVYDKRINEQDIPTALVEIYPDKKVGDLFNDDNRLYRSVYYYAKKNNQSVSEYLTSIGFSYKD